MGVSESTQKGGRHESTESGTSQSQAIALIKACDNKLSSGYKMNHSHYLLDSVSRRSATKENSGSDGT